jgi:L-iditol 2-dehydrogenase
VIYLNKKMKAAFFYGDRKDLRLQQADIPRVGDGDILLKVRICGICGSDSRYYFHGNEPRYKKPVILGHEVVGNIYEMGSKVKGYSPGERVAVAPIYGCGKCDHCLSGSENLCRDVVVFGTNFDGGFAQYMLIPEKGVERGVLVKLADDVPDEAATMLEPFSCALHGLRKIGIAPGDTVAVFGSGPLGLAFLLLSKRLGAGKVAVIARARDKLARAEEFGADAVFSTLEEDWKSKVRKYFRQGGINIAVTAGSTLPLLEYSLELVKRGGKILIFSGLPSGTRIDVDPNYIHYSELTISGTIDSTIDDYKRTALMAPYLGLERFATHMFPLDRIKEGFEATGERDRLRININIMGKGKAG